VGQTIATQRPDAITDLHKAEPTEPKVALADAWRVCDLPALCAFLIYLVLSIFFFGRLLFGRLSAVHIGMSPDPGHVIWFLEWWPHAIAHGLNPMLTRSLWAPHLLNVVWTVSVPFASAIVSPLTVTLGPVVSFNVLCLLSLPLDAWCTFVLCRYLTRNYWTSLLGGYVFGFSAFVLGQMVSGHLQMLLVFPAPMAAYVTVRRFAGEMTNRRFTILLVPLLLAQFLLSLEVFATMTLFAGLVLVLEWSFGSSHARRAVLHLIGPIARSYAFAMILAGPFLYYFFTVEFRSKPFFTPAAFSADLLNLFVPTPTNELGQLPLVEAVSKHFVYGWIMLAADGAYLSLPIIVIAALYAWIHWREPLANLLVSCLIVAVLFSLGPILHIAGHALPIALPWWLFAQLPLLGNVAPACLSMYAFLVLALIVSLWLATADMAPMLKLGVAVAIVAFNLPNLSARFWVRAVDTPSFFRNGLYRSYISEGETVLILPYAYTGNSMLWQAEAHMYFNMVESTIPAPDEFRRWPIFPALTIKTYVPGATEQFQEFLSAHGVSAIVVTDEVLATWQIFLSTLNVRPVKVDGVSLYRLSTKPGFDVETTLRGLRTRFDTERLATLVISAEKCLSRGQSPDSLSVLKATELGLIPADSLIGPPMLLVPGLESHPNSNINPRLAYGVWLGETSDGLVGVGEQVCYSAVASVVEKLRGVSSGIYFPYPDKLVTMSAADARDGWLVITFTRAQLTQASALLAAMSAQGMLRQTPPTAATHRTGACQANVR
jgi:hypothetical protein